MAKDKRLFATKKESLLKTITITPQQYDQVVSIQGNRAVDQAHMTSLYRVMGDQGYFDHCPIKVIQDYKGYRIVDGQHRFAAAKRLGLSVPAIILADGEEDQVVALNVHQKRWTLDDYKSFYSPKIESYRLFSEICRKTRWTPTLALGEIPKAISFMLRKRSKRCKPYSRCSTADFKNGKLSLSQEQADAVCDYYMTMTGVLAVLPNNAKLITQQAFWKALGQLCNHPEFEMKRFEQKLKELSGTVGLASNQQQYLEILLRLYNYKRSVKAHLKF